MEDRKRRASQNNRLLKQIIERLRDYDLEEVAIIRDKFNRKRHFVPSTLNPGEEAGKGVKKTKNAKKRG